MVIATARLPRTVLTCISRLPDITVSGFRDSSARSKESLEPMRGNSGSFPRRPGEMSDFGGEARRSAPVRAPRSTMMGPEKGARTAMWKATIRGLLARKVRLVLTALAVLLGVSFVSATYVLTDTVKQSFDAVFSQTLSGVDLQVQGASAARRRDERRGSPRTCSTRCVRCPAWPGPRGSSARRWPSSSTATARRDRWRRPADVRDLVGRWRAVPPRPTGHAPRGPRTRWRWTRRPRASTASRSATASASC